jgi:hypothetical protein
MNNLSKIYTLEVLNSKDEIIEQKEFEDYEKMLNLKEIYENFIELKKNLEKKDDLTSSEKKILSLLQENDFYKIRIIFNGKIRDLIFKSNSDDSLIN